MTEKSFRRISLFYLSIPNILFFYYWTNIYIVIAVLISILYYLPQKRENYYPARPEPIPIRSIGIILSVAVFLAIISGITGICYQTHDHWCHNVKFYELFRNEWPVRIPADGAITSYYYGYYVFPALCSKLIGHISQTVILTWTALGIAIGLGWIYLVLNRKLWATLLTLCIGDFPHVVKTLAFKFYKPLYEFEDFGIEHWSNFENLLWVPNQVIPSLILGGMLVYVIRHKLNMESVCIPIVLSFWWAIFPALTIGLVSGILIIRQWLFNPRSFKNKDSTDIICISALICFPILLLFLSHNQNPVSGFIWRFRDSFLNSAYEYLVNIGLNILLFCSALIYFKKVGSSHLPLFPIILVLLISALMPLYRIGKVNDFLFRGMMPLLIFMGCYILYPLTNYRFDITWHKLQNNIIGLMIFMCLLAGTLISVGRVGRSFKINRITAAVGISSFEPIPFDRYPNIYEVLKDKWSQQEADQYLGDQDSFYEKWIAPDSLKEVGARP